MKFPNFLKPHVLRKKHLKDNKHISLHLAQKYAQIFVCRHHLFLKARSFPQATLSENCSLLRTDHVGGQISEHISRLLFIYYEIITNNHNLQFL